MSSYAPVSDQWCCCWRTWQSSAVVCCVLLCVFLCITEGWKTKSILSGCVTTKLKFVSVLNIHSQCSLHCTLFKSRTQQAPPWSSKSPQPPHQTAKWPDVTSLCVPSPFFLCHLTGNEHRNDSPLPSKGTQICIPVCFKHLLRPHLAESALGWAPVWFPCSGSQLLTNAEWESV